MRILGIDPGSTLIGFGVIEKTRDRLTYVDHGVLRIAEKKPARKLPEIFRLVNNTIRTYKPDHAGIEILFFSKNKKTALEVAQARGVILLALLEAKLPVTEHNPSEAKIAVTGYGLSDKRAVATMVMHMLKEQKLNPEDNAMDALAIAIAAANQTDKSARGL